MARCMERARGGGGGGGIRSRCLTPEVYRFIFFSSCRFFGIGVFGFFSFSFFYFFSFFSFFSFISAFSRLFPASSPPLEARVLFRLQCSLVATQSAVVQSDRGGSATAQPSRGTVWLWYRPAGAQFGRRPAPGKT